MDLQKYICIFLIIFCCRSTFAQEEFSIRPDINNAYITYDAFSSLIFWSPRHTFGYVYPVHRRWMVGLDVGYGNGNIITRHASDYLFIGSNYRLFEVRPRIYFKLKPVSKFQPYLSAEFFYIHHKDHFINDNEQLRNDRYIHYEPDGVDSWAYNFSYDSADYFRQKTGVNINIGLFLTLFGNFGMNIDAGLGIRNRNINYSNIVNLSYLEPDDNENFVESQSRYAVGNQLGANVSLNFKLFYKFDKGSDHFAKKD